MIIKPEITNNILLTLSLIELLANAIAVDFYV